MITQQQLLDAGYETVISGGRTWYTSNELICQRMRLDEQILRGTFCPYCGAPGIYRVPLHCTYTPDSYSYYTYECGVMAAYGVSGLFTISGRTDECVCIGSAGREEDDTI